MQLLITIKQPFRVWVSVVSAASAFVVKSSDNIVEANIPTSSKSDRVERLIAGSRGDRIPSYFQRSQFPLHPSSPRCSLWMEYPLREEDEWLKLLMSQLSARGLGVMWLPYAPRIFFIIRRPPRKIKTSAARVCYEA